MNSTSRPTFQRVALLIDAENIRPEHLDRLLDTAHTLGTVTIRRAYADWSRRYVQVWREALNRAAIRPFHHYAIANLKNGVDVAMAVDVMRLLSDEQPDAVVMASGDADMAALVLALREAGVYVHGFGTDQTNHTFRACFDHFDSLGADTHPAEEARRAEGEVGKGRPRTRRTSGKTATAAAPSKAAAPPKAAETAPPPSAPPPEPAARPAAEAAPPAAPAKTGTPPAGSRTPKTDTPPASGGSPKAGTAPPAKAEEAPDAEAVEAAHYREAIQAQAGKDGWAFVSSVKTWLMKNRPKFYQEHCKQGRMSRKMARLPEFEVDGEKVRLTADEGARLPEAPPPTPTPEAPPLTEPAPDRPAAVEAAPDSRPTDTTDPTADKVPEPKVAATDQDVVADTLTEAVQTLAGDGGWTTVLALGRWLARERPEFHGRYCGKGRLTPLLEQTGHFELERRGRTCRVWLAEDTLPSGTTDHHPGSLTH